MILRLSRWQKILIYALLGMGAVVFSTPFVWMVSTSLKPLRETMTFPPQWIPSHPQWRNYGDAIAGMRHFAQNFGNTLYLCVLCTAGNAFSSAVAAYGFARVPWRGRHKVFLVVLATMMIPFPVMMVPLYTMYRDLGWVGSFKPLWVPSFFGNAFSIFLLRQFFMTIPRDLSEAATIDGCSEWTIFWRIILPLSKPALLVVCLFQFMATWNDFMGPLIYLTDDRNFTLALALQAFQSKNGGTSWNLLMASSVMVALPLIVLFFFTQRSFVEGIATTGSKN